MATANLKHVGPDYCIAEVITEGSVSVLAKWDGTKWTPIQGVHSDVEGYPFGKRFPLPDCFELTDECIAALDLAREYPI